MQVIGEGCIIDGDYLISVRDHMEQVNLPYPRRRLKDSDGSYLNYSNVNVDTGSISLIGKGYECCCLVRLVLGVLIVKVLWILCWFIILLRLGVNRIRVELNYGRKGDDGND